MTVSGPGILRLDVLEDLVLGGRVSPVVLDDDAGAPDDLPGLAVLVDLAEASPLAELLVVVHPEQRDVVLRAQRHHQLLVHRLVALVRQHAH